MSVWVCLQVYNYVFVYIAYMRVYVSAFMYLRACAFVHLCVHANMCAIVRFLIPISRYEG